MKRIWMRKKLTGGGREKTGDKRSNNRFIEEFIHQSSIPIKCRDPRQQVSIFNRVGTQLYRDAIIFHLIIIFQ